MIPVAVLAALIVAVFLLGKMCFDTALAAHREHKEQQGQTHSGP